MSLPVGFMVRSTFPTSVRLSCLKGYPGNINSTKMTEQDDDDGL